MARRRKSAALTPPVGTPQRRPVDGALVFALALVAALAISWAPLSATLQGRADPIGAGVHYLASLAIVWAGLLGFTHLVVHYASLNPVDDPDADARIEDLAPRRRLTDLDGDTGSDQSGALSPDELTIT